MISRAKTMEDQGNYDGAVHELQEAKVLKPCQGVVAEIDKAIADAQTKIAQAKDCGPLDAQVDIARADYAKKGGLSDTKKELDSVSPKLDKMDANACPTSESALPRATTRSRK